MNVRRMLWLAAAVVVLSACQLDVTVDIVVEPDGTGTIAVTAVADAELVDRVPTIADDLVLDDVEEAGWIVDGPVPTADGGLLLTLTHDFSGADEATNLLKSLGPPFNSPELGRGEVGNVTNNTFKANLGLPGGFADFADADLIDAVGGVPFADEFTANGADPSNSMTAVVRLTLPGDVVEAETNAVVLDDGRLEWVAPLDGTIQEASARTEQAPSEGGAWARPVSIVALVLLVAWVAFMTVFIGYVTLARWRRARRYRRRPRLT